MHRVENNPEPEPETAQSEAAHTGACQSPVTRPILWGSPAPGSRRSPASLPGPGPRLLLGQDIPYLSLQQSHVNQYKTFTFRKI